MPMPARTASNDAVNCPARSRTRNRKSAARSPRSIRRLRICLGGPRPVRVRGHAGDMHIAAADFYDEEAADFYDEEAVQTSEGEGAVHVQEVGHEHCRCLGLQESAPADAGVPL